MADALTEPVRVLRLGCGVAAEATDAVAREEPLEIRLDNEAVAVTMRTPGPPGSDEELAAGMLLAEGLIDHRDQLAGLAPCARSASGSVLNAYSAAGHTPDRSRLARRGPVAASCGVCGKASIEAIHRSIPPLPPSGGSVTASALAGFPARLAERQPGFAATGGVHAAGLFFPGGDAIVREDVGRHNAVDRVLGHALLDGRDNADAVLFESGRVSFEIVQKALASRVRVLAAVGPPTSLAVEFAADSGITLVGFLRRDRMNVYTHTHRVEPAG
ncbi:formate dehydrogenase accessory sulfurtransferase FdhD [Phycisphaera mikurensis]|uniref:Sulfur carrier protein FdhD n=1 Tax=Phycisphaera mikurensis (strain NBRC 102666 / KCTC 22515 / FYK2301M01) TaxID=1142394 RepID=I0IEY2_PHYMF|nr:formate dehydrogenase accessory sulfurtransferase FdhD [Phycisphaera mikurensis]MBB6441614.1 FdhD protein [Phycisphaera mikurensis]BAM03820.1 FdhD protein homolog [Phycisphaera mikurensis NBRC 102666]